MTVRVNSLKGVDAGRYYTERLPSYYLDGGEPPGRWWGQVTDRLDLHGQVATDIPTATNSARTLVRSRRERLSDVIGNLLCKRPGC